MSEVGKCVWVYFLCVCVYSPAALLMTHFCHTGEMTDLFLTRQRMTHRASWMERSASSITSLLDPRTTMLTVFPGLVQPVIWVEGHQLQEVMGGWGYMQLA